MNRGKSNAETRYFVVLLLLASSCYFYYGCYCCVYYCCCSSLLCWIWRENFQTFANEFKSKNCDQIPGDHKGNPRKKTPRDERTCASHQKASFSASLFRRVETIIFLSPASNRTLAMSVPTHPPVPVTILTGFLGSGVSAVSSL